MPLNILQGTGQPLPHYPPPLTAKNDPGQNVNSSQVEKPWAEHEQSTSNFPWTLSWDFAELLWLCVLSSGRNAEDYRFKEHLEVVTPGANTTSSEWAVTNQHISLFDRTRILYIPVPLDFSKAASRVPQVVLMHQLSPYWLDGSRVG